MADFSKQEDRFFDELHGRFVLFGNPERTGSKSTYWMQMNILDGSDVAGGHTPKSTTMVRALEMVLEKIDAKEFCIYQTKEELDGAIAQNEKKRGNAIEEDPLADDRLEQGEDDADDLREERAFFHDEQALNVADFVVGKDAQYSEEVFTVDDETQQDVGQSRGAVRGDDVALDVFEKFNSAARSTVDNAQYDTAPQDEKIVEPQQTPVNREGDSVVETKDTENSEEEKVPDIFEKFSGDPASTESSPKDLPESIPEATPESIPEAIPEVAEEQIPVKEVKEVEEVGADEGEDSEDSTDTGAYIGQAPRKKRHIVPSVPLKRILDRTIFHKVKVPQTDIEEAPPQHVRTKSQAKTITPGLPLLEAASQFWHDSAHIHVTDADAFTADMRAFGNSYFPHFIDKKKRVMYAWQVLRSDAPESFQMSTLFTQFNKKYGEEALVAYLGSLPDQG